MDCFLEPLGRDLLSRAVGSHALGERSAAAQRVVELAVRLQVLIRIALGDVHVEVGLDLADEADVVACELPTGAGQRPQVGRHVIGAGPIEAVGARHLGGQALGLVRQVGGIGRGLVVHLLTQGGVAGEGVDVAVLDPVEAQTEQVNARLTPCRG